MGEVCFSVMPFRLSNAILISAAAICLGWQTSCEKHPAPIPTAALPLVPKLATLGQVPDWSAVRAYAGTITRAEFQQRLETVYALPGGAGTTLQVEEALVRIRKESVRPMSEAEGWLALPFGNAPATVPRFWRKRSELPPLTNVAKPLAGVRIALDPGHLGGGWAVMEERNFVPASGPPVQEGRLTLLTARLLRPLLEALGAEVSMVRDQLEPVTPLRPEDLIPAARAELQAEGMDPDHPQDAAPMHTVRWHAEKLFYRTAEIRARAKRVNETLCPDCVICLHFNAAGNWGLPGVPVYSTENHLHLLVNGAFNLEELLLDDQRQEMLLRLLSGVLEEELGLAENVARELARTTGLPPFTYHGNALPVVGNPYLWSRNLLANRLYACPVVYCEPFIMNHREVCVRLQEGDYEGERLIEGRMVGSIFREYAQGVAEGLRAYFSARK